MTIKQWDEMTKPGYGQKATAEARATAAPAPADTLSAFRDALGMPDATEAEMVARIKELRADG